MSILKTQVPRKLAPLLNPNRYKGAYGGRGGAKSHFFAEQIIVRCVTETTRVVCIREVQNSIKDSVKQLITDKIEKFGLTDQFEIIETEIRYKPNGSYVIFKGMQSYNAANIKSLEAFDIAWVEEAQTFSQHSFDMLRPTLRKKGSELWFSWNPRYKTDPVDVFFRKNKPDNAISVQINWQDNPWFSETELYQDMLNDYATDEDKAEHLWGGAYGASQGAILAKWVNKAEREGRINDDVETDEYAPIYISCDLGFRDTASFWFWQPKLSGFTLIDYDQDTGLDGDDWIPRLQSRLLSHNAKLGKVWLPHDARVKTFQSKHSTIEKFITSFGADKCDIVPVSKKADQISAARTVINSCEFHKTRCEKGLDGLMAWEFEYNEENGILSREPKHDWACFVAGVKIETKNGLVSIENIKIGDYVKTPNSYEMVTANYIYQSSEIYTLELADKRQFSCTNNHKHFTQRGLVATDALRYDDVLFSGKETSWRIISWILTALDITDIHQVITDTYQQKNSLQVELKAGKCTVMFGSFTKGISLKVMRFIILTRTQATTLLKTLKCCLLKSIKNFTAQKMVISQPIGIKRQTVKNSTLNLHQNSGMKTENKNCKWLCNLCCWHKKLLKSGIQVKQALNGTQSTVKKHGKIELYTPSYVQFVIKSLLLIGKIEASTAGRIVALKRTESAQKVFDITVKGCHCYIANGILTSNSHPSDAFAYGCQMAQELTVMPAKQEPHYSVKGVSENRIITSSLDELWKSVPKGNARI